MDLNDLENLIKSRWSVRNWQDKPVSEDRLLKAIEMATWAPNGGNQQNWKFYLIMKRDIIRAIAVAVQARANQMAGWPGADKYADLKRMRDRAGFFGNAPAGIVIASSVYQSPADKLLQAYESTQADAKKIRQWRNIADSRIQSVSASIATLLLALHQMGLGGLWMTGPMQAKGEIEEILKVPSDFDVVAYIPVGYPAGGPGERTRKPVSEICQVIR